MNSRNISLIVVLLLAPIAVWFWMQYCGTRMFDTNYAEQGHEEMFRRVVGFAEPKSLAVTDLAGHHGPGVGMVWMRMKGTDRAFDELTKHMVPVSSDFRYSIPSGQFGVQKTFYEDAVAAGWNQVPDISKPEVYFFRTPGSGEKWNGTIVISRSSHMAYLSANLVTNAS